MINSPVSQAESADARNTADDEAYVQGVRRGGVMVFATGTGKNADQAAEIMNCRGAVEIEKISATRPELPNAEIGEETPARDPSTQIGRGVFPRYRCSPVCLVVSSRNRCLGNRIPNGREVREL
jgi:hypothetical protein